MGLSIDQQTLIEQRVANESKSTGLAYLLWFFFGGLGVHRFYIGKPISGLMMLALLIFGVLTIPIMIGVGLLFFLGLWLLLDLFFIPGLVNEQREAIRRRAANAILDNLAR
jgi:TM2 domain-containing membrane protein YozV